MSQMIKPNKQVKTDASADFERYFAGNMDQRIGHIAMGGLPAFFCRRLAPASTTRR